jgi:hypothetical protein
MNHRIELILTLHKEGKITTEEATTLLLPEVEVKELSTDGNHGVTWPWPFEPIKYPQPFNQGPFWISCQ